MESRGYILPLRLVDGQEDTEDFNLEPGTRLVHASLSIGAAGPPIRASLTLLQPRVNATISTTLVAGWIRGMGTTPAQSGDLTWEGDIPIGTEMGLRFRARNNTGATHGPSAFFVVVL